MHGTIAPDAPNYSQIFSIDFMESHETLVLGMSFRAVERRRPVLLSAAANALSMETAMPGEGANIATAQAKNYFIYFFEHWILKKKDHTQAIMDGRMIMDLNF